MFVIANYLVNNKNICSSGVTKLNQAEQWDIHPVIHLPARPASQTHKFPKGCTNLVPHVSIWMQKNKTTIIAMSFTLLTGHLTRLGNTEWHTLLKIHICIITASFHIKQKIVPY